MRICQINCVYGTGSTGKIVRNIHLQLIKGGYDAYVICPMNDSFPLEKNVYTISNKYLSYASALYRRLFGRQFDGAAIQTNRLLSLLDQIRPDVVHLHCINGNNINIYRLMNYLSKNGIKTVLTLHAEFMYTGGCGHAYDCEKWKTGCRNCPILREATQSVLLDGTSHTWHSMKACFDAFSQNNLIITAVSPWLASRAAESPFLNRFLITTVTNGVDTAIFHNYPSKENEGPRGSKVVLHVTADFSPSAVSLKGSNYIIQLAQMLKNDPVRIVVAANYGNPGILPSKVSYLGRLSSQEELAKLYSNADLTVITSRRETFSMVTAESLCCGTPIVGFEAGGPESIALKEYSHFTAYGDCSALYHSIEEALAASYDAKSISQAAIEKYSADRMIVEYLQIYHRVGEL